MDTSYSLFQKMVDVIAGICLYQDLPSPDNPDGRCAYLMNIYTCPEVQKQGIGEGEAIITWLVNRAADQGILKICLEISKAGKSLYAKRDLSLCRI